MRYRLTSVLMIVLLALGTFSLGLSDLSVQRAVAQNTRQIETDVARLLRTAKSYYENLETDPMADALDEAIRVSGRVSYPSPTLAAMRAEAYILKGVLVFINTENRDQALQYFIQALKSSPGAQLGADFATPELSQLFADARRQARSNTNGGGYAQSQGGYGQPSSGYNQPQAQGGGYNQPQTQGGGYNQPQTQGGGYRQPEQRGNYNRPQTQGGGYQQPSNQDAQRGYNQQGTNRYPPSGSGGYGQAQPATGGYNQPNSNPPSNPRGGYNQASPNGYDRGGSGGYNQQGGPNQYGQGQGQGQAYQQPAGPDITHTPPAQLRGGQPFPIRIRVAPLLRSRVLSANIYYVSRGTNGETRREELRPSGERDFEGQIQGRFVKGNILQYFIVLRDQGQNPVANFKNHNAPQVVNIVGGRYLDLQGSSDAQTSSRFLSAGLSVGAGSGTIQTNADIERQAQNVETGGFALSGFHLRLAADFWISEKLSLGLNTRLQFDRDPVIPAFLVGGLVQWIFSDDPGTGRWIGRVGGGYGQVAHLVPIMTKSTSENPNEANNVGESSTATSGSPQTFLTFAGPVFYQVGLGYAIQLSDFFALTFAVDFMHFIALNSPPLLPDGTLAPCPSECDYASKHFDFSLGFEFTL